jgi:hypothetical protein
MPAVMAARPMAIPATTLTPGRCESVDVYGLLDRIPPEQRFPSIEAALAAFRRVSPQESGPSAQSDSSG